MPVLDVMTESIEPDLGGGEHNLRRAEEPCRVVDDAEFWSSGAACARHASQTPSVASAVTEPASSAVVR